MNKANKLIAILSELNSEQKNINDLKIKYVVLKTKALSPQAIKYDKPIKATYVNSDTIQTKKSELLTATEKINDEIKLRKEFIKYIYEIIQLVDIEYQLHIINIYMTPKWNISKEANKYDLDRRDLAKQIKIQLNRILNSNSDIWNNINKYIMMINDEKYLHIIKK